MSASASGKGRASRSGPLPSKDYDAENAKLVAILRQRDTDPAYTNAPVIDAYGRISRLAYARDLTEAERDAEKVPRQLFDCLTRMLTMHCRLGEVLADRNKSAWKRNGKRPDFERLLVRVEANESNGVLVWHVDRLLRQPWDCERLIRLAEIKPGSMLNTCKGNYDLTDPDDRSRLRRDVEFADRESAEKSRRLLRKVQAQREVGIASGGSFDVFGHRYPADRWPVDDARLAAERDAIEWGINTIVDSGSWGDVAREWNSRGVLTRRGHMWTAPKVRDCLILGRHAGLLIREGEVAHTQLAGTTPIVPAELWHAMMGILAKRRRGRPWATGRYLLTGIACCKVCDTAMAGSGEGRPYTASEPEWEAWTGRERISYRCPARGCIVRGNATNTVDGRAFEEWAKVATIKALASPKHASAIARRSVKLSKIDSRLGLLEDQISDAADLMAEDPLRFTAAKYRKVVANLTPEITRLQRERAAMIAAGASPTGHAADVAELERLWDDGTVLERRAMVRSAFPAGFHVAPRPGPRLIGKAVWVRFSYRKP